MGRGGARRKAFWCARRRIHCPIGTPTPRRGCRGASGKPPCIASTGNNFAVSKSPWWGLTRRLRRELGLAVPRGAHTFLSVAKEKCAKESQRHGDSGKKAFTAHFDGGARYVARSIVDQLTPTIVRARSSPFSAVKMGGPFSLRCLSPLCSPAVGVGQTQPLQGFCFRRSRRRAGLSPAEWDGFMMVGRLCRDKSQQVFEKMWAFAASHEACRRMAVYAMQLAGSRTRPASRGTCCATAVKPRPSRMSPECPARHRRAVRGAGVLPLPCLFADAEAGEDVVEKLLVYAVAGDAAQ